MEIRAMEVIHQFDSIDESLEENGEEQMKVILENEVLDCDGGGSEEEEVQYHLCEIANSNDKTVAYRVLRVSNDCNDSIATSTLNPATVQVLTSPSNDQFYVLSDGSTILPTEDPKPDSTRLARLQVETSHEEHNTGMKKRDERRRMTHNEVERRRRDKINNWITKLGKLLPDCDPNINVEVDMKSKGGILARACEYITELREMHESFTQSLDENGQLLEEAENLRKLVNELKKENTELKTQIPIGTSFILGT